MVSRQHKEFIRLRKKQRRQRIVSVNRTPHTPYTHTHRTHTVHTPYTHTHKQSKNYSYRDQYTHTHTHTHRQIEQKYSRRNNKHTQNTRRDNTQMYAQISYSTHTHMGKNIATKTAHTHTHTHTQKDSLKVLVTSQQHELLPFH